MGCIAPSIQLDLHQLHAHTDGLLSDLLKQEMIMNSDIEDFWEKLKTERDEMRVQAHLARAELRDEWEEVEEKWQQAEQQFSRLQDQAVETTAEMQRATRVVMEEIAKTYDRIKQRLDD